MVGEKFFPFLAMVIVQLGYAGMNIISKLAMDSGMNPYVHVAYRQIFASVCLVPLAYFLERKTRPKMTLSILFQIFLCSIFGGLRADQLDQLTRAMLKKVILKLSFYINIRVTLNQITYFVGLKNSTPTIACALTNINPAVTFLMAIPFGLERWMLRTKGGKAKVLGTLLCVGGALLLSFYHGDVLNIGKSSVHWKYAEKTGTKDSINHVSLILGPFLLLVSAISWAIWLILQTRVCQQYGAPYSSSAIMCTMASVQCVIVAFGFDHNLSAWSLSQPIRIVSAVYSGIICSAMAFCLMTWCIRKRGPLYVSVFSPLLLVIVAILSWVLLEEKLYIGTFVGSVLIVVGLYGVLWGKNREIEVVVHNIENQDEEGITARNGEITTPNGMEITATNGIEIIVL